eukprot:TRINITY_DN11871_c0_g1_i1.p1 TRINITY_DN11871_c0_g1~~TRINITY_DN11871_c0_g1_i1.p1  ORF type:complete len:445 (-),score=103.67 TRINITY_DN11871_c0_g1_i1:119-1453(-)
MPTYLGYFATEHVNFRIPELESIAKLFDIDLQFVAPHDVIESPFIFFTVPTEEDARKIGSRSVGLRVIIEVWGQGLTYDDTIQDLIRYADEHKQMIEQQTSEDISFKFNISAYGRKYSRSYEIQIMEKFFEFGEFSIKGSISLTNPEQVYWIIENIGISSHPQDEPIKCIYFGRQICLGSRDLIDFYDLKKRDYIGTTSMNAELSLFSSNQGLVLPGSLVFDPFTGTGGLLVTSAHFGGYTFGSDLDIRALRGIRKGKKIAHDVYSNYVQYGLTEQFGGLIRGDFSQDTIRTTPILDAIITDPPYGVRAGAKKIGYKKGKKTYDIIKDNELPKDFSFHISQTVPYFIQDVLTDLFDFSARMLVLGGRLVYWLPTTPGFSDDLLPSHPCFRLVSSSEQPLSRRWGRRLVTMEKFVSYTEEDHGNLPKVEYAPDLYQANFGPFEEE